MLLNGFRDSIEPNKFQSSHTQQKMLFMSTNELNKLEVVLIIGHCQHYFEIGESVRSITIGCFLTGKNSCIEMAVCFL